MPFVPSYCSLQTAPFQSPEPSKNRSSQGAPRRSTMTRSSQPPRPSSRPRRRRETGGRCSLAPPLAASPSARLLWRSRRRQSLRRRASRGIERVHRAPDRRQTPRGPSLRPRCRRSPSGHDPRGRGPQPRPIHSSPPVSPPCSLEAARQRSLYSTRYRHFRPGPGALAMRQQRSGSVRRSRRRPFAAPPPPPASGCRTGRRRSRARPPRLPG